MDNSPRQIREALERSDDWADFDILELERLTEKRYMYVRARVPEREELTSHTYKGFVFQAEHQFRVSNLFNTFCMCISTCMCERNCVR